MAPLVRVGDSVLLSKTMTIQRWKQRARHLKSEIHALYLACRDPRVPWYARFLAMCVVGYTFSPIDLIPDPIPILGYLDDLLVVPLGIALVVKLIPAEILAEHRTTARTATLGAKPKNWIAAGFVITIWLMLILGAVWLVLRAR
jgi:uncharacterized membrane protein YkvA (DUF1232 family)